MATVVVYNEENGDVLRIMPSVNTPEWENRTDTLINPSIPPLPQQHMIVDNGALRERTQEEKDAKAAELQAQQQAAYLASLSAEELTKLAGPAAAQAAGLTNDEIKLSVAAMAPIMALMSAGYAELSKEELQTMTEIPGIDEAKFNIMKQTLLGYFTV